MLIFYFNLTGKHQHTGRSPPWDCSWFSVLCFLLDGAEAKRLVPFDLQDDVKSSLENLCLEASERGEMGERSIFSFLLIGIAKLRKEITGMECHTSRQGKENVFYMTWASIQSMLVATICWEIIIPGDNFMTPTITYNKVNSSHRFFPFLFKRNSNSEVNIELNENFTIKRFHSGNPRIELQIMFSNKER